MFKPQLWWLLLVLCSFNFRHPHRNEDWSPCTNCYSLFQNRPLPPTFCLLCYFLFHPSNSGYSSPANPPHFGEKLFLSVLLDSCFPSLAEPLSFSWHEEHSQLINQAFIRLAGAGCTSLPTALSCLWPTSAHTAVGLLSPLQGLLILCRRCYWRPPRNLQSLVQYSN